MEPQMSANPTIAGMAGFPWWTRFVVVNNRIPRAAARCALCCEKIEKGYVRESQTRLLYCDAQCFAGHEKRAMLAIEDRARKVS
jgi:hypothetical protein